MPPALKRRRSTDGCTVTPTKPGPSTVVEVFDWPADLCERLVTGPDGEERRLRLRALSHGVQWHVTSDYSGFDCPREAMRVGTLALQEHFKWKVLAPRFLRSCDVDSFCQKVLKEYSKTDGGCVFADINDRLPVYARNAIDGMEPEKLNNNKDHHRLHRQQQHVWIVAHKEHLFSADSTSRCLVHNDQCPTLPQVPVDSSDGGEGDSGDSSESHKSKLRLNIAGTCCQGWSLEGKQWKDAHSSERPHSIWQCEREQAEALSLEDGFIQECTPGYDMTKLTNTMEHTHYIFRIITGPLALGYPVRRQRSFVAGLSKRAFVWHGPADMTEVQQQFETIFNRYLACNGSVFLNADKYEIHEEMRRLAANQANYWPAGFNVMAALDRGEDMLKECLAPGVYSRYQAWEAVRVKKGFTEKAFFSDVDHNPGTKGPAASDIFPCELRHNTVIAHHLRRACTPLEVLSSHGFHLHAEPSKRWGPTPVRDALSNVSKNRMCKLGGNGINLPSFWAVLLYTLSSVSRREETKLVKEIPLGSRGGSSFFEEGQDTQDTQERQDADME